MSIKLFITGTDTEIGKTYVTVGLLNLFSRNKYSTLGLKPLSSGGIRTQGSILNQDALLLQNASSIKLHYHQINPFVFEPPIAPHIAASFVNREITVQEMKQKTQYAYQYPADICLIEGVGGWYTPLNLQETMADFIKSINIPTLLVVGLRLGCINHALLTMHAILKDQIPIVGWIGNCIDPNMHCLAENISTLDKLLKTPCLGIIPFQKKPEEVLDINLIRAKLSSELVS